MEWTNVVRKLSDLQPWERNPRQINEKQAERLKESFEDFGQVETIAIGPENEIYNGHQRLNVLMDHHGGDYEIECRQSDRALSEKEREKLTVFLHKGAAGEWDWDILANEFEMDDLLDWGFEEGELFGFEQEPKEVPEIDEDQSEHLREKWGVLTGQLWQLGQHRILCGDCTDKTTLDRLVDNNSFNVLTDPPYNIGFNYDTISDDLEAGEFEDFCNKWFSNLSDATCIIFTPGPKNIRSFPVPRDIGYWHKKNATAGASAFHLRGIEPILIYGKIGHKRTNDYFDFSSGFSGELKGALKEAGLVGKHPPSKPIELWKELIKMFDEDLIVDVFLGSGTTILACEVLNRRCYGLEISENYVALAIERWHEMTGEMPELI